jgi:hypothetical protein
MVTDVLPPRIAPRVMALYFTRHGCSPDSWRDLDDNGLRDILRWPVARYGRDLPDGRPFPAWAACPACGKWEQDWFIWGSFRDAAQDALAREAAAA